MLANGVLGVGLSVGAVVHKLTPHPTLRHLRRGHGFHFLILKPSTIVTGVAGGGARHGVPLNFLGEWNFRSRQRNALRITLLDAFGVAALAFLLVI